eukprot:gene2488-3240_t
MGLVAQLTPLSFSDSQRGRPSPCRQRGLCCSLTVKRIQASGCSDCHCECGRPWCIIGCNSNDLGYQVSATGQLVSGYCYKNEVGSAATWSTGQCGLPASNVLTVSTGDPIRVNMYDEDALGFREQMGYIQCPIQTGTNNICEGWTDSGGVCDCQTVRVEYDCDPVLACTFEIIRMSLSDCPGEFWDGELDLYVNVYIGDNTRDGYCDWNVNPPTCNRLLDCGTEPSCRRWTRLGLQGNGPSVSWSGSNCGGPTRDVVYGSDQVKYCVYDDDVDADDFLGNRQCTIQRTVAPA